MRDPRSILITGASSGLGAALAEGWAASGRRLHLSGRNTDRLEAIAEACRAGGAEVVAVDVTDREATRQMMHEADDRMPLTWWSRTPGSGTAGLDRAESEQIGAVPT